MVVFPWLPPSCWKRTTTERLVLLSRWQFRGAVSCLLDTRSESTAASQTENKMDCQPRCPRGKMETATTFGRVMSSVVQPSRRKNKNAETIACFYSIFLSLSHSWGKLTFPPLLPPSIISVHLSSVLPPCQQRCATVAERPIFHHSAHEYWTVSSRFY